MYVSMIPPEAFVIVAKDAEQMLAPAVALSNGRENMESVWTRLLSEDYQLWMFFDEKNSPEGALVTRVEQYPLKKMLNLLFIGGANLEGWHEELLSTLEDYAKKTGCAGMETVGRMGWKRFLKDFGWEATHVVCEKTFDVVEEQQQDAA